MDICGLGRSSRILSGHASFVDEGDAMVGVEAGRVVLVIIRMVPYDGCCDDCVGVFPIAGFSLRTSHVTSHVGS